MLLQNKNESRGGIMELYGVLDSEGNIYAVYWSPDDPGPDTIQLIENYTDAPSDWICRKTGKQTECR